VPRDLLGPRKHKINPFAPKPVPLHMRLMAQSQFPRDLRRPSVVAKQNHLDARMQPRPASQRIPLNHAAVTRKRLARSK
jgi:hypothetical protein